MSETEQTTTMTSDKPAKTSYLILVEQVLTAGSPVTAWVEAAVIESSSADTAIRRYLAGENTADQTEVPTIAAVPTRSFTRRTPRIVTETRLVLE